MVWAAALSPSVSVAGKASRWRSRCCRIEAGGFPPSSFVPYSRNYGGQDGGQAILMRHYLTTAAFCGCLAIWSTDLKANARVEYVHPENFTDVSFRSMTH